MTGRIQAICVLMLTIHISPSSEKPLPSKPLLYDEGQAAYYSPSYTQSRWERIYSIHKLAGRITHDSVVPSKPGYHCVHANIDKVGVTLILRANNITIECVTADLVQFGHKHTWRSHWAIELSWTAFKTLKLHQNNHVQVYLKK